MTSRAKLVSLALVALLIGGVLAWQRMSPPVVAAVEVREATLVRSLRFSARVTSAMRVDVGSTITGRVAAVDVAEGATVRSGDALVRLDASELDAALAQAKAGERQAQARIDGLRGSGRRGTKAGIAQGESVLAAAQADLARTQALVTQGFLSAARLDDARRAVAVARAQLEAARAQDSAVSEQGGDLAQARAQLAVAQAATAAAQARLTQAMITAPTDARVLARLVEPGQIVQPGRALVTLALAGPMQLEAQVDERYLEQLRVGQAAVVVADAFPDRRFVASVASISPLVDAQRGAVEVKLALVAPLPDFLREDMTLSVDVETARVERARSVPLAALRAPPQGEGAVVLVAKDGRVEERAVRLGLRTLEAAEVVDGLAVGDEVLVGDAPAPGKRVKADARAALLPGRGGTTSGSAGAALTNAMGR